MSKSLTKNQVVVLNFLASKNKSPSYAEIAAFLGAGYTRTTVMRILDRLQRKGLISKKPRTPRSIQVLRVPDMPQMLAA